MERMRGLARKVRPADVRRFAVSLLPTVLAIGTQAAAFAVTARALRAEQFGRYAAVLAVTGVCIELVGLGGSDLLVKAVAIRRAAFSAYFGNMLLLLAVTLPAVVASGVLVSLSEVGEHLSLFDVSASILGETLVGRVAASTELAMVAHGHLVRASSVRLTTALSRLLTAVAFFHYSSDLRHWILAVSAQCILLSAAYIALLRVLYGRPLWRFVRNEFGAGVAFSVNQTARAMQTNIDRLALAHFASDAALGAYAAGTRLLQLGLVPIQIVTRIVYPRFFEHGLSGLRGTRKYGLQCAPALLGVGVASAVGVALCGLFAPALLGASFAATSESTPLLACALPLIALQYPAADALTGAGYQRLRTIIFVTAAVGFGIVLVAGAAIGEVRGVIFALIGGHALLAAVLWLSLFKLPDGGATEMAEQPDARRELASAPALMSSPATAATTRDA
ncbi:MAG: lipopolysaccharide biosynthesis protein [Myxococcaceae bacterium]|nr:lipopolysaccharide biosynthesis protein [Myxococcaceae bacterium]